MVHNYYLYEKDGKLSMIPWDYNLAYGTFHTLQTASSVNDPIDTPLSVTGDGDRPMMDWIINNADYLELYHQYFAQFLSENDILAVLEETLTLITPYVEKDPTRFYTISEFEAGVETMRQFLTLRIQSVEGQLNGTIPATAEEQTTSAASLIDTGNLILSDMGAMNMGGMGGFGGNQGNSGGNPGDFGGTTGDENSSSAGGSPDSTIPTMPEGGADNSSSGGGTDLPGETSPGETTPSAGRTDPTDDDSNGTLEPMPNLSGSGGGSDIGTSPTIPGANPTEQIEQGILLAVSLAVLVIGLVIAYRFKRR